MSFENLLTMAFSNFFLFHVASSKNYEKTNEFSWIEIKFLFVQFGNDSFTKIQQTFCPAPEREDLSMKFSDSRHHGKFGRYSWKAPETNSNLKRY